MLVASSNVGQRRSNSSPILSPLPYHDDEETTAGRTRFLSRPNGSISYRGSVPPTGSASLRGRLALFGRHVAAGQHVLVPVMLQPVRPAFTMAQTRTRFRFA